MPDDAFDWEQYPGLKAQVRKLAVRAGESLRQSLDTREYRNKFVPTRVNSYAEFLALSPKDGDWIRLPSAFSSSKQTWWQFVYDSTITDQYKWVFMGGPPLSAVVTTDEAFGATTNAWVDLATVLDYTLPYGGYYDFAFGAHVRNVSAVAGTVYVGVNIHTGTPGNCQVAAVTALTPGWLTNLGRGPVFDTGSLNPIAAGSKARMRYQHDVANAFTAWDREMSIVPRRIGQV
jgi:hypothetical protein